MLSLMEATRADIFTTILSEVNISEVYKLAHAARFLWFHLERTISINLDGGMKNV